MFFTQSTIIGEECHSITSRHAVTMATVVSTGIIWRCLIRYLALLRVRMACLAVLSYCFEYRHHVDGHHARPRLNTHSNMVQNIRRSLRHNGVTTLSSSIGNFGHLRTSRHHIAIGTTAHCTHALGKGATIPFGNRACLLTPWLPTTTVSNTTCPAICPSLHPGSVHLPGPGCPPCS